MEVRNRASGGPLTDVLPPRKPLTKPAIVHPLRNFRTGNRYPVRNKTESIISATEHPIFNQVSSMYFNTTVPIKTPIMPDADKRIIRRLSFNPLEKVTICTDESRLNKVSRGMSDFIGTKCASIGRENKANPKPVVPFTIPDKNITSVIIIQVSIDMLISYT